VHSPAERYRLKHDAGEVATALPKNIMRYNEAIPF